jgi:N-acetylglucosaminyldiphosphoundecaprenol N-acetyl-beta-D-mannosaminyltransferase
MKHKTVTILGSQVSCLTMAEVLEWVRMMVEQRKPRHIVTANAEIIYKAYREEDFRRLLAKADLLTADGSGVMLASRILGEPIPERVTGVELTEQLFELAEEKGWGLYFLGASQETVEKAVLNVLSRHTRLRIVGYRHGYYSQEETAQVLSNIKTAEPDILLAALGVPKQEEFIQEHLKDLQVPVSIGIGGTFDILAGTAKRAPVWMRRRGLEWLYRLYRQPSRYKRMLALPKFLLLFLKIS